MERAAHARQVLRAVVQLGALSPADVRVVVRSGGGGGGDAGPADAPGESWRLWSVQSYRNGMFVFEAPAVATVVGLLLELASLALFWAAIRTSRQAKLLFAFDPGLPHGLLDAGPYRYVRHPFYTSYLLFWIGWAIAIWSPWTLPFIIAVIAFYVTAATGEERKFAATGLSADYQRYRQRAGLFWPTFAGLGFGQSARE